MKWFLPGVFVILSSLRLTVCAQDIVVVPLDTVGNVGSDCRLRIDSNDNSHIVYQDYTNNQYKHAYYQDTIWHFDILQYNGFNDYEVDNYGNIHAVRATESRIFYYLISSDTSMETVVDSIPWGLRYSDSEIELVEGTPRIVCVQYMTPAYLIEANLREGDWIIDTVSSLPDYPSGIVFKVFGDTNCVSFTGTSNDVTGLYYRRWIDSWAVEETIWPNSVNGIRSMTLDSNGRPWIAFAYDNGFDNYHGVVAYKTGPSWQWDYVDTAYYAPEEVIYSQFGQRVYYLVGGITLQSDPNLLYLAGKTLSGWEYEQLYSARRISGSSGAFDSNGNLHFCFSVYQYPDRDLYYGFRRSIAGIGNFNPPDNIAIDIASYPNPFNSSTTISFELARPARITLAIYDLLGRRVAILLDGERAAGTNRVTWEAGGVSSGIYFARLATADGQSQEARLLLVK